MDIAHAKLAPAYSGEFSYPEWAEGPESVQVVLSAQLLTAIHKALSVAGIDKVTVGVCGRDGNPVSDLMAIADFASDRALEDFEPHWEIEGLTFGFGGPELSLRGKWDYTCRGVAILYPSEG